MRNIERLFYAPAIIGTLAFLSGCLGASSFFGASGSSDSGSSSGGYTPSIANAAPCVTFTGDISVQDGAPGCASSSPTIETCSFLRKTAKSAGTAERRPLCTSGQTADVLVNASAQGAEILADQLGGNLGSYTGIDITQSYHLQDLKNLDLKFVRWPGGSLSDTYHWQNNTSCSNDVGPNDTFNNFINSIVKPGNFDFAITVDYGTNVSCNGGGDPAEAAAWVAQSAALGYTGRHWTVGNEVYGSWETDKHAAAHDPGTYVTALNTGYYPQIKAADSTAQVGAVVSGYMSSWDNPVISGGKYDFLEVHWYPQNGNDSDSFLLQSPATLTNIINNLRSELVAAGKPANTPILLGEFNSEGSVTNLTRQSVSIVNGLFAGMTLGEILNDGLPMAAWWAADTEGDNPSGNTSVYGWQNFGTYSLADPNGSGTIYPDGRAYQLASQFAVPGNRMLTTTVNTSSLPNVRAYGATLGSGYALMLFNLDENNAEALTVGVSNSVSGSFTVSSVAYGKAQYDNSQNNVWTAPVSQSLGTEETPFPVTLPPWSITVLKLQ